MRPVLLPLLAGASLASNPSTVPPSRFIHVDRSDAGSGFNASSVTVYLGSGCFWGRQHDYAEEFERKLLGRTKETITAVGGYFGGESAEACYYNAKNFSVYAEHGHAEVIRVSVPLTQSGARDAGEALEALFRVYFSAFVEVDPGLFVREDYFDQGAGYRALVGFPLSDPAIAPLAFSALHRANSATGRNMRLIVSAGGSDGDTLGKGVVYVMDSANFVFHQAELCLQFRNNQTGAYPKRYHDLKGALLARGLLKPTECPENYVC